MLWGGLRRIPSRVVLDVITLLSLSVCAVTSTAVSFNCSLLIGTVLFHLISTDFTNRWPIALPMMPFALLQICRRVSGAWRDSLLISTVSITLIFAAAALCVLFPAVQLPAIKGKYNVGVVDLFLPVDKKENDTRLNRYQSESTSKANSYVTARLLYPTSEKPDGIPLINPALAKEYLKQSMKFGAPPPLQNLGWMLHTWRLTKIPAKRNAKPALNGKPLPMIVYSHGLGGNASVYSYQTMMMASSGSVVLALDHSDGSAPVMEKQDGTKITLDFTVGSMWFDGKKVEYVRARRALTNMRVKEFLAAAEALQQLNERNISELESIGISFVNQLDLRQLHFAGHSFGGATAMTAGKRRPDLPRSILAHDPAVDWLPDDVRHSLFAKERLSGSELTYGGGTGGYEDDPTNDKATSSAAENIHKVDILYLYSEHWYKLGWGESRIVEDMKKRGVLGPKDGTCEFGVVSKAQHNEFSDTCVMTPLWLARAVGVTGTRNPLDTAEEIALRTKSFLDTISKATK